ncbi:MAG: 2-C-methyl-D-erythritol 2,4-cyclodiphosphate synthase [Candidatus Omnitrophica bacterium]|nr:2-C-methyl-D-erythritol 2,4-cyclodiphosphate synthase [Candidatus Omnitrophota bacterium]
MRVGIGYDSHRFSKAQRPLKLGGVTIPDSPGLEGHSDADVVLHAVADALLGAVGGPDLGELFPSSDPRYHGMPSRRFIAQALRRVREAGWRVGNVDMTVVADRPTLAPYKVKMRRAISGLLGITEDAVSVKAKTAEGFPPKSQGIMAYAVALLEPAGKPGRAQRT